MSLTSRTIKRLLLLRPTPRLRRRIVGILARAQRMTGVRVHNPWYLSNHGHVQASVQNVGQMAEFMCYVNGNIARELCHLIEWSDRVWAREYKCTVISDEPAAQIAHFRYVLEQGTKEGLVASPLDWPGVNPARTFAAGRMTMQGEWVDRTAMRKAREKGRDVREADYTFREALELTPIPCMEDLSQQDYLSWVGEVIEDIELEAKRRHEENGTRPLGAEAVCAKSPFDEPAPAKKTPAPLFLTASREAFLELREAYRLVVAAYMEASARFRDGDLEVEFPVGTFPPAPKPRLFPPPRGPGP